MKLNIWPLIAGLMLIGGIFWVAWSTTSHPMMLGGLTSELVTNTQEKQPPLAMAQASSAVENYLSQLNEDDLYLYELMQFDNHFYAAIAESKSDVLAFEILIDSLNGQVVPEPGPNMMWNKKYGHMTMGSMKPILGQTLAAGEDLISPQHAYRLAQGFLDQILPGTEPGQHAASFYGYYTLHILKADRTIGMLSVNGDDGRVWIHSWHGAFIDEYKFSRQ